MRQRLRFQGVALLLSVLLAACGGGGGGDTTPPAPANAPPTAAIGLGTKVRLGTDLVPRASVGERVQLDAANSRDPEGQALTYAWTLAGKPAGSASTLEASAGAATAFTPDQLGDYVLRLTVTDSVGATTSSEVTVVADNRPPGADVVVNGSFVGTSVVVPPATINVGTVVRLDGTGATDADGDAVAVAWTLVEKPAGSAVALDTTTTAGVATFRADALGTYRVTGRMQDTRGAWVERQYSFVADNRAPTVPDGMVTASFVGVTVEVPLEPLDVDVGLLLVFDGRGSTDLDGDPVTISWTLTEKPAASTVALDTATAGVGRLRPDALGTYRVTGRMQDPRGAWVERVYVFNAVNRPPTATVAISATFEPSVLGTTIHASTGYTVLIDSAPSSDPDGDTLTYAWEIIEQPATSTATLGSLTGATSSLAPDKLGLYRVRLTVTDERGVVGIFALSIVCDNARPVAALTTNATPKALPTAPPMTVPLNTYVSLRGDASSDPDGDPLVHHWILATKPTGSTATLSASSGNTTSLTVDVDGSYVVLLRVTDNAGAFSERTVTINAGNSTPHAIAAPARTVVVAGQPTAMTASLSFDDEGDTLTYQWTLDARPSGSAAVLAATTASAAFTPDVPGTYVARVLVSDGRRSSTAFVEVEAKGAASGIATVPFTPALVRYSRGLDLAVMQDAGLASVLRIVDPFDGNTRNVVLPKAINGFNLSPDGLHAIVAHDAALSYVRLADATLVRVTPTAGNHSDAFVTNDGHAYAVGDATAQVITVDVRNGSVLGSRYFYFSGLRGVWANSLNRAYVVGASVSPADVYWFGVDAASRAVTASGDSPYHGEYLPGQTVWLSQHETTLFSSNGLIYRTSDLTYAGTLADAPVALGMSHSTTRDELLLVHQNGANYEPSVRRYAGAAYGRAADLPLPLVGGQQSYARDVFHTADGRHLILVQVGSSTVGAAGVTYHFVVR